MTSLSLPVNPHVVYVSGDRQDLPSANGCSNYSGNVFRGDASLAAPWQNVVCNGAQNTSPHADSRKMVFDHNGNLLQANDGGFYRLDNPNLPSRKWVSLNGNLRPTEMHSAAFDAVTRTAIGGTQDTGTPMQNSPGHLTWTDFLQGDGGVVEIDDKSGGGAYSTRYSSFEFLDYFNRSTWSPSNTLISGPTPLALQIVAGPGAGKDLFTYDPNIQFYNPYTLNRIDPRRMLIGTTNIYESRDQGDTLVDLIATNNFITSLSYGGRLNGAPVPDAFYVGTAGPGQPLILRRATAGGAIQALAAYPGSGVNDLVMDPKDIRRVYVVDNQNRVWASFDAGLHWYDLTANLPKLLGSARTVELAHSPCGCRTVLAVGGLGGVAYLYNPGMTAAVWSRLGSNLPHGLVLDLRYNDKANVLIAGVLGRGAWTLADVAGGSHATWQGAATGTATTMATTTPGTALATQSTADPGAAPATASATSMALPLNVQKIAPRVRSSASQTVAPVKP